MMRSELVLVRLLVLALICPWIPPSVSEFTVIMSDSSTLVDAPQTGFSDRARTDPEEQKAVYEIMEATGNGWAKSIADVCRGRWHGIECMPDRDEVYHVVSLSFGVLSDDTAFPACDQSRSFLSPALARLPHARSLFFYRCFTDNPQPIPRFLARLGSTLRSLVLRENGHVGPIPSELGNLTSLKLLDLHKNNLSSRIPASLAGLIRLRLMDLSDNRLTGAIPGFDFPTLNVLDLNNNLLQGQIPTVLGRSASLIKMDLSRNRLVGTIPDSLCALRDLTLLDLSRNRLSGPLPSSLGSLTSLRALILNGNSIGPASFPEDGFAGLKDLMTLVLSDAGLRGPIPESIGRLPSLRVLHLNGNDLNGSIPSSFRGLEKLSELRLDNNQLTGPLPFSREVLWRMERKLRVSNNSGLCYDASTGREQGADSSHLLGISSCDAGTTRATVSTATSSTSAAAAAVGPSGQLVRHLTTLGTHSQTSHSSSSATTHEHALLHVIAPVIVGILLFLLTGFANLSVVE